MDFKETPSLDFKNSDTIGVGDEWGDRSFREWHAATQAEQRSAIEIQKDRNKAPFCALTLAQLKELNADVEAHFLYEKQDTDADKGGLFKFLRKEKNQNKKAMREIVDDFIIPRTVGKGVGYALLRNVRSPLQARVLISHVWKETLAEFLMNLDYLSTLDEFCPLWICFTALYQRTDRDRSDESGGLTLTEYLGEEIWDGPFVKVLTNQNVERMIVNQTKEDDGQIRRRLWCLWEMFQALNEMKKFGRGLKIELVGHWSDKKESAISVRQATCSVEADKIRITNEIESKLGFDAIEKAYDTLMRKASRAASEDESAEAKRESRIHPQYTEYVGLAEFRNKMNTEFRELVPMDQWQESGETMERKIQEQYERLKKHGKAVTVDELQSMLASRMMTASRFNSECILTATNLKAQWESLKVHYYLLGRARTGKSFLLNALANGKQFESCPCSSETDFVTKQFGQCLIDKVGYLFDSPPVRQDSEHARTCAEEILKGFQSANGGVFRLFFVFELVEGRPSAEDVKVVHSVLTALNMDQVRYSVVINKVRPKAYTVLLNEAKKEELDNSIKHAIGPKYPPDAIYIVRRYDDAEDANNVILDANFRSAIGFFTTAPCMFVPAKQVQIVRTDADRKEDLQLFLNAWRSYCGAVRYHRKIGSRYAGRYALRGWRDHCGEVRCQRNQAEQKLIRRNELRLRHAFEDWKECRVAQHSALQIEQPMADPLLPHGIINDPRKFRLLRMLSLAVLIAIVLAIVVWCAYALGKRDAGSRAQADLQWTPISTSGVLGAPRPRFQHSAIYATATNKMYIFGGYENSRQKPFLDEVWALDLATNTWTYPSTITSIDSPYSRSGHSAIYARGTNIMYIFGGWEKRLYNDVWALELATETWTSRSTNGAPPPARMQHSAIYAMVANKMYIFGGYDRKNRMNDVWALDFSTQAWALISTSGALPSARAEHSAIHCPARNRMYIFGGYDGSQPLNDVWTLDLAAEKWKLVSAIGGVPTPRRAHSAIYAASSNRMYIFGGRLRQEDSHLNDVWAYDLAFEIWISISAYGGPPPARRAHSAIYATETNKMYIFGGYNGSWMNDVWALSLAIEA